MSASASQATMFYKEVAAKMQVFTFTEDESYLIMMVNGAEVVPFWSSVSRCKTIAKNHPKYASYDIDTQSLDYFFANTLPLLQEEDIKIGINWSGDRLTGYDISVYELEQNIRHYMNVKG